MATPNSTLEWTARGRTVAWLAALAGGAAWLGGDENARLAAAMLAAPVVVDFVAKQRRLHYTAVRVAPRTTTAGAVYTEVVTVEHRGRRSLRHCQLSEPRTMRHEPPSLLPTLAPFEPQRVEVRQRSVVRSHVVERVFLLESRWPLGMFATRSVVSADAELITEPARVALRADVLEAAADAEVAPVDRTRMPGQEFYALREHTLDEDARGVHALRSAALGTLVRRVTRGRMPRTIGVVLDLRRPPGTPRGRGMRRGEWSLGACATLVDALHRQGADVQVLVVDETPEIVEVRGPAQLTELLTLLSEATLCRHAPIAGGLLDDLRTLAHCYWIPAGGFVRAPELDALPEGATLVEEDRS